MKDLKGKQRKAISVHIISGKETFPQFILQRKEYIMAWGNPSEISWFSFSGKCHTEINIL